MSHLLEGVTFGAIWEWSQKFSQPPASQQPLQADRLDELSDLVHHAVFRRDLETLDDLHEALAPIVGALDEALSAVPRPVRQAMSVASLASWVRSARDELRYRDPVSAARQIPNGPEVLEVLTKLASSKTRELTLQAVQQAFPGKPMPKPTLSRALGRLEDAGFVLRRGNTRAQRIELLPKVWRWLDARSETTSEAADEVPAGAEGGVERGACN